MILRFHIQVKFSRTTKFSLIKIRKQYFLDAAIFLATGFFFFIITFCINFDGYSLKSGPETGHTGPKTLGLGTCDPGALDSDTWDTENGTLGP